MKDNSISQYAKLSQHEKEEVLRALSLAEYKAISYADKKALGFLLGDK